MGKTDAVISDKSMYGVPLRSIRGGKCYVMIYVKKAKEIIYLEHIDDGLLETKIHGTDRDLVLFDDKKEIDEFIKANELQYSQALLREADYI